MAAVSPCNVPDHLLQPLQAPPAFAKAAGEDARMLQAVADAHAAFERSLLSSRQQAGDPTAGTAVSHSKSRGIGLRVGQAHGIDVRGFASALMQPLHWQSTTSRGHLMAALPDLTLFFKAKAILR
jgi:hypothetical protein